MRQPAPVLQTTRLGVWAAASALLIGCGGSDRGAVSGTVQLKNGQPLVGARVIASPQAAGKSAYGTTDQQGQFELGVAEAGDGIPAGDYTVVVIEDRGFDSDRPPSIARKYARPETSGLKLTVEAGQSAELDLTLDPP
jgi:hypothetical protein